MTNEWYEAIIHLNGSNLVLSLNRFYCIFRSNFCFVVFVVVNVVNV